VSKYFIVKVPRPGKPPIEFVSTVWPANQPLYRGHGDDRDGNVFNPGFGKPTRFAFFPPHGRRAPKVPVLYAGATPEVAVSEYIFHDVPLDLSAAVPFGDLKGRCLSAVVPIEDLTLVRLHDTGLRKLKIANRQLIETPASAYRTTVRWAQALHASNATVQGLQWMSRQYNSERAVVLFGDRIDPSKLALLPGYQKVPVSAGRGLDLVMDVAEEAGIVLGLPS
jgi:hypothetical protein